MNVAHDELYVKGVPSDIAKVCLASLISYKLHHISCCVIITKFYI